MSQPWKMFGPFALNKHVPVSWQSLFRDATKLHSGLSSAAGVYIIATKLREKEKIRYVGMTHNQGFEAEIFSQRNRGLVWDKIYSERNSEINIWLIAKRTPSGKSFAWQNKMANESFLLETLFIMHAKAAGHRLINTSKMKSATGIAVEGLFGKRSRGPKPAGLRRLDELLKL